MSINPFSSVTQNLWYQHYLNKKRLNSWKIGIHYEYMRPNCGKCQYCGKQLELQHYDWVILEYDCK